MKWIEVEEIDRIAFEEDFGEKIVNQIDQCVDTGSLHILIEIAAARLREVNYLNKVIDGDL